MTEDIFTSKSSLLIGTPRSGNIEVIEFNPKLFDPRIVTLILQNNSLGEIIFYPRFFILHNNECRILNSKIIVKKLLTILTPKTFLKFPHGNDIFIPNEELFELVTTKFMYNLIKSWKGQFKEESMNRLFYTVLKNNYVKYIKEAKLKSLLA